MISLEPLNFQKPLIVTFRVVRGNFVTCCNFLVINLFSYVIITISAIETTQYLYRWCKFCACLLIIFEYIIRIQVDSKLTELKGRV